jgi:glycosyltransferase involved in cell wall biosynthesis
MRVLHVDSAHEWRGGPSQVLLAAREMTARGHAVTVACRAGGGLEAHARAAGLDVRPLVFGGDLHPGAIWGLRRVLRETRPDVVHVHDPHATGAGALALRMLEGRRPRLVASRRVPLRLRGALSRMKYGACDRVLAVSRAVARRLAADGLPSDKLIVVRDGVPDRHHPVSGSVDIAGEFGLPTGSRIIGNVAALSEHKDHGTLLSAMPAVLEAVPDARLLIVGEGRLRTRLQSEARRLGLGGRCVFTGSGESPVSLLTDEGRRERMGRAGRCRFERHFTAGRMVDETLRVYERLTGPRPGTRRVHHSSDRSIDAA